jgi:hypothetical protein
MKKIGFISAFLFAVLWSVNVNAQSYKTAAGIRISSQQAAVNNSVTLKHFFSESVAIEGLLSFGDPVAIGALVEKHQALGANGLMWFWGAGAYFAFAGPRNAGLQGVAGLDYRIPNLPINLSVDWKPELNLAKQFSFEPAAVAVSARFVLN